jgi:hypothetical protein
LDPDPEIGAEEITGEELAKAKSDLSTNPPQRFDLARRTRIYQTRFQFVEMELHGCHVDRQTISLPMELFNLKGKRELAARLQSRFRLVDGSTFTVEVDDIEWGKITLKSLQDEAKEIRSSFLKSLGARLGNVMLKQNRSEFERRIGQLNKKLALFKKECAEALRDQFETSRSSLVGTFVSSVMSDPPDDLRHQVPRGKPDEAAAKLYLEKILNRVMPSPETFLKDMRLDTTFKDVTIEMLRDDEFQAQIREKFPFMDWDDLFIEEDAIKAGAGEA